MNGWIRLHRQIEEWEWYSCPYTKAVFIHLLIKASWKDARWQGINIPRGSLFCSLETLAASTGLSIQRVRTALARLKSTREITSQSTHRGTLVTLCKWDDYNGDETEGNTPINTPSNNPPTYDQHASNMPPTTSEEGKEGKEGKKGRKKEGEHTHNRSRPSSREEFDAYFREIGLYPRDADATWDKWEGNGWVNGGKKIVCWKSTIRSWKARGFMPSQAKPYDYEKPWPSEKQAAEPEEEVDMMAMLRATIAKEEAELYKDHPDNWTAEEWAERQAIDNF